MNTSIAPSLPRAAAPPDREAGVRHLPPVARAAYARFQSSGDLAALDPVLHAILEDYIPRPSAVPLGELPGHTRLIDDLGFDSLAITEVVFFAEDLFGIGITNEEISQVRTLADLQGFIRGKVALRAAR